MYNKLIGILFLSCFVTNFITAQNQQNLDKIVAVVGDKIILQSDINQGFKEILASNPTAGDKEKCGILENLLSQNILCEQAKRDSVTVTSEEVEGTLDNRIRYFMQQYGTQEKMEEVIGKSLFQLKEEYRRVFEDQLLAQKMQTQIMSNVKITPNEVRTFYDKIPNDSLPFYPSMVECGQIVITPTASKEVEDYARHQLEDIKQQIIDGKNTFEAMAGIYSEDPGSRDQGGDLGIVGRDDLVSEFSAAAFKLQNGEMSGIVKTKFGFHLIQMVQRMGEKAKIRHILIKPKITSQDMDICLSKMDSIRNLIVTGKMNFNTAVGKFSTDEATKNTGGMFSNRSTGTSYIGLDELEPSVALEVAKLKSGDYSKSASYQDINSGDKLCRIIFLKNISEPHKANLK